MQHRIASQPQPRGCMASGCGSSSIHSAQRRSSRRRVCLHTPAAAPSNAPPSAASDAELASTYALLASLVTPPGDESAAALIAGPTPLGRGLIAARPVNPGQPLLTVEAWNALCISDDPEGYGGGAFGAQAVADWQAVHGELPVLLNSYLLSGGEVVRRCAWLVGEVRRVDAWMCSGFAAAALVVFLLTHPGLSNPHARTPYETKIRF